MSHPNRSRLCAAGSLFCAATTFSSVSLADNPIVQTIYAADPAPMVYGGGSISTPDMTRTDRRDLTDERMESLLLGGHGELDGPWVAPEHTAISAGPAESAWAGQVIYRDGRFFYYVPVQSRSLGRKVIGVAVSTVLPAPSRTPWVSR